jgi:cytoskeletal protein RodZ
MPDMNGVFRPLIHSGDHEMSDEHKKRPAIGLWLKLTLVVLLVILGLIGICWAYLKFILAPGLEGLGKSHM